MDVINASVVPPWDLRKLGGNIPGLRNHNLCASVCTNKKNSWETLSVKEREEAYFVFLIPSFTSDFTHVDFYQSQDDSWNLGQV